MRVAAYETGWARDRRVRDDQAVDAGFERDLRDVLALFRCQVGRDLEQQRHPATRLLAHTDQPRQQRSEHRAMLQLAQPGRVW